jgi:hypothetical protein
MGDGRYYTYYQFFDVLILMSLSVLSVVSILFFYYRKNKDMFMKDVMAPAVITLIIIVIRVIETVIPNMGWARGLRELQLILMMVVIFFSLVDFNRKKMDLRYLLTFIMIFSLAHSLLGGFVETYVFHHVVYSKYYKILIFGILVSLLALMLVRKKKEQVQIIGLSLTLLVLIYFLMVLGNYGGITYIEPLIIFGIVLYLICVFRSNSEFSHALLAFEKIGNISSNYLFVLDQNERLIYSNDRVKESKFFENIVKFDRVEDIFICDCARSYTYLDHEYIDIKRGDEDYYFAYSQSQLFDQGVIIGKVITVTNITELILLLKDLEMKKQASMQVNDELKNYSQVVYYLEKEKEINHLLEEIVLTRQDQMNQLIELISKTDSQADCFEKDIDQAICESNVILEEVRKTVSQYREYYGG